MSISFENALQAAKKELASMETHPEVAVSLEITKTILREIRQLEKTAKADRSKAELYYDDGADVFLNGKVAGLREAREVIERYLERKETRTQ